MADFEALKGRPGATYTGPLQVAARHAGANGLWPAVILIGKGAICSEGMRQEDIRCEMTPAEAEKLAHTLLNLARRVD